MTAGWIAVSCMRKWSLPQHVLMILYSSSEHLYVWKRLHDGCSLPCSAEEARRGRFSASTLYGPSRRRVIKRRALRL
jgi:hypothetical protein